LHGWNGENESGARPQLSKQLLAELSVIVLVLKDIEQHDDVKLPKVSERARVVLQPKPLIQSHLE
jgi:hypothetical protein